MIRAFQTVALTGAALGRTELLARGIYEAMITTAAGLSVAIPVLIGYHWIAAKVQRLVLELDQTTMEFVEQHRAPTRPSVVESPPLDPDAERETEPASASTTAVAAAG
jgi:biopolymer transport protein ExbB/TolQ